MKKPQIIVTLEAEAEAIFDEDNKKYLTAKQASRILGCTEQSIINAAYQNKLPFGFVTVKPGCTRRTVYIPKLSFFNFLDQGVSDRVMYDSEYDLYVNEGRKLEINV